MCGKNRQKFAKGIEIIRLLMYNAKRKVMYIMLQSE